MPRTISVATTERGGDHPGRSSGFWMWRLVLAGAVVAGGLAFGTDAWANVCFGSPVGGLPPGAGSQVDCACNPMVMEDNVWTCTSRDGMNAWNCTCTGSGTGCTCTQVKGGKGGGGFGGGGGTTGSGGGGGTPPGGSGLPPKGTRPITK